MGLEHIRTIVANKDYFEEFLKNQPIKVRRKIFKIFEIIEYQQHIPIRYLEHIKDTDGLYEAKVSLGSDIWRVFCFFDAGRLVILLNGFQKKTKKTPKSEIALAIKLKVEYFDEKRKGIL